MSDPSIDERHLISWSGGSDSTVMLHYLINEVFTKDTDFRIFYMDTSIVIPATIDYLNLIIDEWGLNDKFDQLLPEKDFFEILEHNHFWPSIARLWCAPVLKHNVMKNYYMEQARGKRKKLIVHIGVSIFDSKQRLKKYSNLNLKDRIKKFGHTFIEERYPLLRWTDFKKDAYKKKHNIPKNPSYKLLGVSGCYVCPFYHLPYYKKLKVVYPEIFWKLYEWEIKTGSWISPEHSISAIAKIEKLDSWIHPNKN